MFLRSCRPRARAGGAADALEAEHDAPDIRRTNVCGLLSTVSIAAHYRKRESSRLRVPPPRRLFLPCCLQPVARRALFAAADLVWSARCRGRLPIRGNHWTESNFRTCRLTSCGTYTCWLMRFSPRGWLLRRLNSKDDLSNSVKKTSRTTQEDKAGPPVHAGGPFGTNYAGSEAESEEALMQTDLLLTWGALFGTIVLFAYSTTRR